MSPARRAEQYHTRSWHFWLVILATAPNPPRPQSLSAPAEGSTWATCIRHHDGRPFLNRPGSSRLDRREPEHWISEVVDEGERYAYCPPLIGVGFFEDFFDGHYRACERSGELSTSPPRRGRPMMHRSPAQGSRSTDTTQPGKRRFRASLRADPPRRARSPMLIGWRGCRFSRLAVGDASTYSYGAFRAAFPSQPSRSE